MFEASMPFCLIAPPTPTPFGVFAFHHKRSHPLNLVLLQQLIFPFLHALERSSLVAFIKSTKDFLLYNFFTQSLLWASSGNSSSPCTYRLITIPHWILRVLLHNLCVPSCNLCSLDFSLFFAFLFDSYSSCHNTYPSQNRVPIFIPLLYFSSIIRVFINSPFEKL
jgi:hypothetical protein